MMTRRETAMSDFERVKQCFDAYGADIAKWPADKREKFGALAAADEMTAVRNDAAALDDLLGAASAPQLSPDLKNRIAAQYAPPTDIMTLRGFLSALFVRGRFIPAGAVAGIGALGLATGVLTANSQAALTPEAEVYAYLEDVTTMSLFYQEEAVSWDED